MGIWFNSAINCYIIASSAHEVMGEYLRAAKKAGVLEGLSSPNWIEIDPNTRATFSVNTDEEPATQTIKAWLEDLERGESGPWILYTENVDLWNSLLEKEEEDEELAEEQTESMYRVGVRRVCPCKDFALRSGEHNAFAHDAFAYDNRCPVCMGEGFVVRWIMVNENPETANFVAPAAMIQQEFLFLDAYRLILDAGYRLTKASSSSDECHSVDHSS